MVAGFWVVYRIYKFLLCLDITECKNNLHGRELEFASLVREKDGLLKQK